MTRLLAIAATIGLLIGGAVVFKQFYKSDSSAVQFRTEKVTRGDLHITVRATGTVEPEETVDVGAQVVGRISALGKDPRGVPLSTTGSNNTPAMLAISATAGGQPSSTQRRESAVQSDVAAETPAENGAHVPAGLNSTSYDPAFAGKSVDYGSPVTAGMVLAQIDPAIYKAQFDQATASLEQAKAKVLQAQSLVAQTAAEWQRAQRLREITIPSRSPTGDDTSGRTLPINGISDADYVLAEANAHGAQADLEAAKATVLAQQAVLELAKTNLNYTTIISPIDGTIIDRRVNIGQTVVSSLNAPSLFLIARDLRRMQVWASVNEADIAKLIPGTKVHFTVDALPDDTFQGVVVQRRLNASMTNNVVIYPVVVSVDNSDLKLLPYLTANVYFEVDNRQDVLLVPNSALRYKPAAELIDRDYTAESNEADGAMGRRDGGRRATASNTGRLWVVAESGKLRPVDVQLGTSDLTTSLTEIIGGEINEGDEVVLGERREAPAASNSSVNNPLAPPRFRSNRTQSKNPT